MLNLNPPREETGFIAWLLERGLVHRHLRIAAGARELAARVRALTPWPGVTVPHGDLVLKIGKAEPASDVILPPADTTFAEAGTEVTGEGLIPD